MNTKRYRVENESVYEYDEDQNGYVFIGKLNGEDFRSWVEDYECHYDEYNPVNSDT